MIAVGLYWHEHVGNRPAPCINSAGRASPVLAPARRTNGGLPVVHILRPHCSHDPPDLEQIG